MNGPVASHRRTFTVTRGTPNLGSSLIDTTFNLVDIKRKHILLRLRCSYNSASTLLGLLIHEGVKGKSDL
ncbi:Grip And Coiled-Coil Domain-Containing Protein 1 [Manis pentadactyla]|nr:Grip And Coiled-Coil Domain-Containing Protein 1 [Manis pentadactyla]